MREMTAEQFRRLTARLSSLGTQQPAGSPRDTQSAGDNCYLEYEYGRRYYDCDDDRRFSLPPAGDESPHCYYEDDDGGEREYECEDERYTHRPPGNTPTPPIPDPVRCYWDEDEYECYYADGRKCEYEHGRWECEYEYGRRRAYYRLPTAGDALSAGGPAASVRGHLKDGAFFYLDRDARFGSIHFTADTGLQNTHFEYRPPGFYAGNFSVYVDWGLVGEERGATRARYGKLTSVYSPLAGLDLYAHYSIGEVDSNYYQATSLRGYSSGVLWRGFPRKNIALHLRNERHLSADEIADDEFALAVRIGYDDAHWQLGGFNSADDSGVRIGYMKRF